MNYLNLVRTNDILNKDQKALDLIFTNIPDSTILKSEEPLVPCDPYHPSLEIIFSLNVNTTVLNTDEIR